MKSGLDHAHAWKFAPQTVRRSVVLGVIALLAVLGLYSVASAAASSSGRAEGNLRGGTSKSSLAAGLAPVTDSNLVNPWGIAFGPTTPLWVANNGTSTSTL